MSIHKYKILFMFGLCGFLTPFVGNALNLALPFIAKDFDMNVVSLGWVATTFLLSTAVFLVPLGRLADIWGRRKLFIGGTIIFTLTSLLCSVAFSGPFLLVARAFQGLGSAMIFGTSIAILVSLFPPQERGRALGINTAGVYMGSSMGPAIGGLITQYLGWRYIFIAAALLGMLVICMSLAYIKEEWAHANGEKFDLKGSILYGLAVIAMLYGTTMLPAIAGYLTIITGVFLFIVFCILEDITAHPVFDINVLLKNRKFAMSNLATLLNFSAAFAVPFTMSLYLQYIRNLQPNKAGLLILIIATTVAFGSPIVGRRSDHRDPRILASLGMAIDAVALFGISFALHESTPFYLLAILFFCFGLGQSLFATPNTHATMEAVTTRHLGIASSLLGTMRMFGQTLSMGITMLVFSLIIGKIKISSDVFPQLIQSTRIIFFIFGLLCVVGVFASMARGARVPPGEEKV